MVLSAEEYSKRAAFYEKMADDERASRELRIVLARKANWLHILARLEAKKKQSGQSAVGCQTKGAWGEKPSGSAIGGISETLLFSPRRMAAARRELPPRAQADPENFT
jgi:hypothetical protein